MPRRSWHSCMIGPTYSCGRCTVAVMIGSSIASYLPWSGTFAGLSSSMTSPSCSWTR